MDFMKMLKQAQTMQGKMQALQEEAGQKTVEGVSGGGLVKVSLTGKGEAKSISIDPSLLTLDEKEILQDLLVAAFNDAKAKTEILMQEETQKMMGDLGLPPGLDLSQFTGGFKL